jgi:hypothetical protein
VRPVPLTEDAFNLFVRNWMANREAFTPSQTTRADREFPFLILACAEEDDAKQLVRQTRARGWRARHIVRSPRVYGVVCWFHIVRIDRPVVATMEAP